MKHYFSENNDMPLNLKEIKVIIWNLKLSFYTCDGVFSKNRLDKGTRLLIEKCDIQPESMILDLGCSIGLVGLILKMKYKTSKFVLTDINPRAVYIAKLNAKKYYQDSIILKSDGFEKIKQSFDTILFNPPQSAGRKVCLKLISEAKFNLKKKGNIQVVARHNKGGEYFSKFMEQTYGNCEQIAKSKGYRIYKSKKTE